MAVLGSVWWEYWGTRGGIGEQNGGSIGRRLAVLGCPTNPLNNSGGVLGDPLAP